MTIQNILLRLIAPFLAVFFAAGLSVAANAAFSFVHFSTSSSAAYWSFYRDSSSERDARTRGRLALSQALPSGLPSQDDACFQEVYCRAHPIDADSSNNPHPFYAIYSNLAVPGHPSIPAVPVGNRFVYTIAIDSDSAANAREAGLAGCNELRRQYAGNSGPPCVLVDEAGGNTIRSTVIIRQFVASSSPAIDNGGDSGSAVSAAESSGGGGGAGAVIGGIAVVGGLAWYISSGGVAGAFSFTPDFGYSATESGYSYNVGGRADFVKDNWRLYWTATQNNGNGDFGEFAYASGGSYNADFWNATFSESVQGKIANYNFALSADVQNGIWKLSPTYRFNSRLDWKANESDSRNSLNIESVLRMNRWTIRPTAGFNWRRMNEFGDSAKFGVSAAYRL